MNKNLFKKIICFVIALMMVMPNLPGSIVSAAEVVNNNYTTVVTENNTVSSGWFSRYMRVQTFVDGVLKHDSGENLFRFSSSGPGDVTVTAKPGYFITVLYRSSEGSTTGGNVYINGTNFSINNSGTDDYRTLRIYLETITPKSLNVNYYYDGVLEPSKSINADYNKGDIVNVPGKPDEGMVFHKATVSPEYLPRTIDNNSKDISFTMINEPVTINYYYVTQGKVIIDKTSDPVEGSDTQFDITLSVEGTPIIDNKVADVVLVFDKSGSMDYGLGDTTRMDVLKEAANRFIDKVLPAGEVSLNQVSIVTYSGNTYDGAWNDAQLIQSFTSVNSIAKNSYAGLTANGGTNSQSGFMKAEDAFNSSNGARQGVDRYVIYMTDGAAGYYYDDNGYTAGTGNPSETNPDATAVSKAIAAAKDLKNETGAKIYTVALINNDSGARMVLDPESPNDYHEEYFHATTAEDLTAIYSMLANKITDIIAKNAVTTDIIAEGFVLADGYSLPEEVEENEEGHIIWNLGDITTDVQSVTFRVEAEGDKYGSDFTNESANLKFNHVNSPDVLTEMEYPKPLVPLKPIARNDEYSVHKGGTLITPSGDLNSILSNDTNAKVESGDYDVENLIVLSNTNPANGSLTVESDGSFTYTPESDFIGTVTFNYTIQTTITKDGSSDYDNVTGVYISTATVTINVLPPYTLTINYFERTTAGDIELSINGKTSESKELFAGQLISETVPAPLGFTYVDYTTTSIIDAGISSDNTTVTGTMPSSAAVINLYYTRDSYSYTINYYKDTVTTPEDETNYLGTETVEDVEYMQEITLTGEQLNAYKPTGYQDGEQQGDVPYVIQVEGNVINVLYEKRADLSYTINYYKDTVTTPEDANYLGTETVEDVEYMQEITLTGEQLNAYKPTGYQDGEQQGDVPYVIQVEGNVINVLYEKRADLSYTINYYKDTVTTSEDANYLGTETVEDVEYMQEITLTDEQLNAYKPTGYQDGEQQGDVPYVIQVEGNVINVLYEKRADLSYTINYYKDTVTTPEDANYLGTETVEDVEYMQEITLTGVQLDAHKPIEGYQSGVQQGDVPYVIQVEGNVINVLYEKRADLSYTINYYKDTVTTPEDANYLGTETVEDVEYMQEITLTGEQLNAYKPTGYQDGEQQGDVPYVIQVEGNVINVLYEKRADLSYTINYYKDTVTTPEDANYLGTETVEDVEYMQEITLTDEQLNAYKPTGYQDGEQQGDVPYVIQVEGNVINVLYEKRADLSYTINYYKDTVTTPEDANYLGTETVEDVEYMQEITLTDEQLNAYKPTGYQDGEQQGDVPYVIQVEGNVINVLYEKRADLSYTINYYKDTVTTPEDANYLGTETVEDVEYMQEITLTGEQLNAYKPTGYQDGEQQGDVPYVIQVEGNVINVLYEKRADLSYTINYYKDTVTTSEDANYLGTETVEDVEYMQEITLTDEQLNAYKPTGYQDGEQQGDVPYVIQVEGNVINVLYEKRADLSYTINYYKDTVTTPEDANYLGTETVEDVEYMQEITLTGVQLDAHKPIEGYQSGVQQGDVPYVIQVEGNVINVLYEKRADLSYTINYYKDTVTTPEDANYLGTETVEDVEYMQEITLTGEQLNAYKPTGYQDGEQQGDVPYVIQVEGNVINVLYEKRADLSYTINYYKDTVTTPEDANYLGTETVEDVEYMQEITLTDEQLNAYKPTGYQDGEQQGDVPYVIQVEGNVINVLYEKRADLSYTINYYKDTVTTPEDANYLGTETVEDVEYMQEITLTDEQLNAYKPTGYQDGEQQGDVPYVIQVEGNVINVLYEKRADLSYTINYYKDTVTTPEDANYLGTETVEDVEYMQEITLTGEQLNAYKPTGYQDGEQQGDVPYVIQVEGNVINVLYEKRADLSYTINYYKDTVTTSEDANYLGTETVEDVEYMQEITLTDEQLNAYKPTGYQDGEQQGDVPYVIQVEGNVINVLYEKRADLSYTINYYKDTVTTPEDANYLGTETVEDVEYMQEITLTGVQLDAHKPIEGYQSGVQQGDVPYVIQVEGNVINVLYEKRADLSYTINYYKDTVTTPEDANYLGTETVEDVEYMQEITLTGEQLNAYKPTGYQDGEQQGDVPYVIQVEGNVINVLYEKRADLSYTINYYKDTVTTPEDANYLGTETVEDVEYMQEITLTDEQLNAYKPTGYQDGEQQGDVPYVIQVEGNVINVLYEKRADLSYTINYYKDTVTTPEDANYLGTETVEDVEYMQEITLTDEQLNAYKPTGYQDGEQQGDVPYVIQVEGNVINVLYEKRADLSYTINYYKDTVTTPEDANYLGTETVEDVEYMQEITLTGEQLNAYKPTGYQDGEQQGDVPYVIQVEGNVINVLYEPNTQTYTVNHYLHGTTSTVAQSETKEAKFGDIINGADEALTITGYVYVSSDPEELTIGTDNSENVINVYYTNETIEIPVSKMWTDGYEEPQVMTLNYSEVQRPDSITLHLINEDGDVADTITLTNNDDYWYGYFVVPKYDKNNDEIDYSKYTVVEEDLEDYISIVESWLIEGEYSDGFGVYNIEAVSVPVTKEWEGPSEEIEITLLDENGEPTEHSVTLNADNEWQDYFKLPKYDFNNDYVEIDYSEYSIEELEVEGYISEIKGSIYDGFNIVNRLKEVTYTINYLEYGTDLPVAPTVTKSGIYFDEVTEYAVDVEGYNKVGKTEITFTLGSGKNDINFYYSEHEVIDGTDYHEVVWKYETGYNTNVYTDRYELSGEGEPETIQYYVDLHYDSGYTYTTYKTWTEDKEVEVVVDVTTGSAITGSALTGTAIKIETTSFIELFYDRNRPSRPDRPDPPVIIEDPETPLAELEKLDHFAYVIGYPEGDVRPLNNITREEVAMIFYRLLTDDSRSQLLSDVNPFTDMNENVWSNRAVSTLYNAGIIAGYPDGTFKPSDPITRAEFATIAAKFDKLELGSTSNFTDIFGHWAEKYITSAEIKGWIKGYPDMTFKPEQDITRAESMTLINNVLERAVPEENIHPDAIFWPDNQSTEWYYEAVMEATNSHDYIFEEDGDELWTGMKPNKVWP